VPPESSSWPGGSRLTAPSVPDMAMTFPFSSMGSQAEFGERHQQVVDAAGSS